METDNEKQHNSEDEMLELLEEFMQADEEESLLMLERQGAILLSDAALQSVHDKIAEFSEIIATLEEKLILLEQTKQRQEKAASSKPPPAFPIDMMKKLLAGMADHHIPRLDPEEALNLAMSLSPDMLLSFASQASSPQQQAFMAQLLQNAGFAEQERNELLSEFIQSGSYLRQQDTGLLNLLVQEIWKLPIEERKRFLRGETQVLNWENILAYVEEHHIDISAMNERIQQTMATPSPLDQFDLVKKEAEVEQPWSLAEWEEDLAQENIPPEMQKRTEQPIAATQEEQLAQFHTLVHELQQVGKNAGNIPFSISPDTLENIDIPSIHLPRGVHMLYRITFLLQRSEKGMYWPDVLEAKAQLSKLMEDPASLAELGPAGANVELYQLILQLLTQAEGERDEKEMSAQIDRVSEIIKNANIDNITSLNGASLLMMALLHRCMAYLEHPSFDQEKNFALAIQDCDALIKLGASLQRPLIEAYGYMIRGVARTYYLQTAQSQAEIKQTLHDLERALLFFTREQYLDEWTRIHLARSAAYRAYHYGDVWQNYEYALQDAQLALAHLSRAEKPMHWALAHKFCGEAYAARLSRNPLDDARKACEHYRQALQVLNPQSAPGEWASTRISLAVTEAKVLVFSFSGDQREARLNIFGTERPIMETLTQMYEVYEKLIADLTEVSEATTREGDAYHRADAYYERAFLRAAIAQGERTHLLQMVLADFEHALEVFTPERYPVRWADTQYRIAQIAPRFTIIGAEQRAEMALRAIDAALTVYSAAEMPFDYHRAQKLRAIICESLQHWSEAWQSLLEARRIERFLLMTTQSGKRLYDLLASFTQAETSLHLAHIALHLDPPNYAEAARALEEGRTRSLHHTHMPPEQAQNLPDMPSLEEMTRCLTHPHAALVYLAAGANVSPAIDLDRHMALGVDPGFACILTREDTEAPKVDCLLLPRLTNLALTFLLEPAFTDNAQATDSTSAATSEQTNESERGRQGQQYALPIKLEYALNRLGDMGLNDLAQYLQSKEIHEITLITYSNLGLFPLNAAHVTLADGSTHYLGELFEVSFAPSAYAAARARQRAAETSAITGVLAAGNPRPKLEGVAVLPYAAGEAQLVSELATASAYDTRFLPSEQITRDELLHALCDHPHTAALYAHLAIHAFYQPREPRHSQLILAGTSQIPESKRSIFASELLDGAISLSGVRLLVLSACQSSVIDIGQVPNEVVGLAAAFLQAGAAGVVASLWKVADMATYLLMSRFARIYLQAHGQISPANALAQAQRWLREEATYRAIVEYNPLDLPAHHPSFREWALKEEFQEQADRTPDALPFARPEYWAAFILNGY